MKASLLPLIAGVALLSGCATNESTTNAPAQAPAQHSASSQPASGQTRNEGQPGAWNKTPEIGMTKAAVTERYGDPSNITREGGREVWHYSAKVRGQDYIPVYGGFTRQYRGGTITFGADGRVADRKWGNRRWGY